MKKLIYLFITLAVLVGVKLSAEEKISNFEKAYYSSGEKPTKKLKALLKKDIYFQKAIESFNKGNGVKKQFKDVETGKVHTREINAPRWDDAYGYFIKSAQEYKNPISAFSGLNIINSFVGKKNALKNYKLFTQILYEKGKNNCEAYLNYAEIYIDGIYEKQDKKRAASILEEGLKGACSKGWKKQVVMSKLWGLRR